MAIVCGREVVLPNPSSNQEVYDYVCKWLLEIQGCPARGEEKVDDKYACYYRMYKDGGCLACAAGCLIPDEDYKAGWETLPVHYGVVCEYFQSRGYNTTFLQRLQEAHDSTVMPFEKGHQRVAVSYSLIPYVKAA